MKFISFALPLAVLVTLATSRSTSCPRPLQETCTNFNEVISDDPTDLFCCMAFDACKAENPKYLLHCNTTGTMEFEACDSGPIQSFETCNEYGSYFVALKRHQLVQGEPDENQNDELRNRATTGRSNTDSLRCKDLVKRGGCGKYGDESSDFGMWCLMDLACENRTTKIVSIQPNEDWFCVYENTYKRTRDDCIETTFDAGPLELTTYAEYESALGSLSSTERVEKGVVSSDCSEFTQILSCNCGSNEEGEYCFINQVCGIKRPTVSGVCFKDDASGEYTICRSTDLPDPTATEANAGERCLISLDFKACNEDGSRCYVTKRCLNTKEVEFIGYYQAPESENDDYEFQCALCSGTECDVDIDDLRPLNDVEEGESDIRIRPLCPGVNQNRCPEETRDRFAVIDRESNEMLRICETKDQITCVDVEDFTDFVMKDTMICQRDIRVCLRVMQDIQQNVDIVGVCSCDVITPDGRCMSRDRTCFPLEEEIDNCTYTAEQLDLNVFQYNKTCFDELEQSQILIAAESCIRNNRGNQNQFMERMSGGEAENCKMVLFCSEFNETLSYYDLVHCPETEFEDIVRQKATLADKAGDRIRMKVEGPYFKIESGPEDSDNDLEIEFEFTSLKEYIRNSAGELELLQEIEIVDADVQWTDATRVSIADENGVEQDATRMTFTLLLIDGINEFEVYAEILTFDDDFSIEFGDSLVRGDKDSIKFTLKVLKWQFLSEDSILVIGSSLTSSQTGNDDISVEDVGMPTATDPTTETRHSSRMRGGRSFLSAPQYAIIDGVETTVNVSLARNSDVSGFTVDMTVSMPFFEDTAIYDPVMGIDASSEEKSSAATISLSIVLMLVCALFSTLSL